jgi:hypothetical protein
LLSSMGKQNEWYRLSLHRLAYQYPLFFIVRVWLG